MATIDDEYITKQCQRLGNKANAIQAIADEAAAQATIGNLPGAQALLVEAARKFRRLEDRRLSIINLIAEALE